MEKKCCEVDGEYSCCDSDVDLGEPSKVYAGVEYVSSVPFAHLSYPANESKQMMSCGDDKCYLFPSRRCGNYCCGHTDVCCGHGCYTLTQSCCGFGCCGLLQERCGNGCCGQGYHCCGSRCCNYGSTAAETKPATAEEP
ncbi:unnamed protein product [Larinioides sclopetarius]|uniref:Uncharacterized protein n=1 Tax=Larinioides sclopetarius TaxID=280406 RepID=A0AAV2B2F6_9ARAC